MTKHLLFVYDILLDTFGYHPKWYGDSKDEIIIGAILTQHTNWHNVEKALSNLRERQLLSLSRLTLLTLDTLSELIKPAGYHHQKAQRLKDISISLTSPSSPLSLNEENKLPTSNLAEYREYLLSLKGIGPETADCILLYAFEMPIFVIDAYTIRVFSRLGLCKENVKYQTLQNWFMAYLPKDVTLYSNYHTLLTKFAKVFCRKVPHCRQCPLKEMCLFEIS